MKKLKKVLLAVILSLFSTIYGQDLLTNINASWSTVLPGKVVSDPELFTKGFAVMTDARSLMAFTNDGSLLWEKYLPRFYSPFFTFIYKDFCSIVTNNGKRLTLLNPDGNELWIKNFDYEIIDKPFPGRDGRFFVRGTNILESYTISGLRKWSIETPEQNRKLQLQELTDGSIILFLNELSENKTKALRITPFGEVIEDITFAGEVTTSLTTPDGILLTFTDGSSGLFDLKNNKAEHKWLLQKNGIAKNNRDFFVLSQNKREIIYLNHHDSTIEIDFINTADGSVYKSFLVKNIKPSPECYYNDRGILLCDYETAYFYNTSGKLIWSGTLPPKGSREYYNKLTFTTDNHLILFSSNWSINSFRTSQGAKNNLKNAKNEKLDYSSFYKYDSSIFDELYSSRIDSDMISAERKAQIRKGDYGLQEQQWISQIMGNCTMYLNFLASSNTGTRVEKSVFEKDSVGLEKMLGLLSDFQTDTFNEQIVLCLKRETNRALLSAVLEGISKNGYDPDEILLKQLSIFGRNLTEKDESLMIDICDAVYAICQTMGTQAFNDYGKTIYTEFLYPKYPSKVREYSKEKLKLLING